MKNPLIIIVGIIAVVLISSKVVPQNKNLVVVPAPIVENGRGITTPPKDNPIKEQPTACTMDAKQCPDGSYVGRTGPKCEFAMCPSVQNGTTAKINQKIQNNGVYITALKVTEDSRCPSDVTCIQAGTVKLSVKLEVGTKMETVILELGKSFTFSNKTITLTNVTPNTLSTKTIAEKDYVFTFLVK